MIAVLETALDVLIVVLTIVMVLVEENAREAVKVVLEAVLESVLVAETTAKQDVVLLVQDVLGVVDADLHVTGALEVVLEDVEAVVQKHVLESQPQVA